MGHRPPEKRPGVLPVSPWLAERRKRMAEGKINHRLSRKPPEGTPEYEAYRRRMSEIGKIAGRTGIPHGWGRRREELMRVRAAAREKAKEIVAMAIERDAVDPVVKDNEHARIAMEFLVSVIVAKDENGKPAESTADRIKAAQTVLNFTKERPQTKVNAVVQTAEDWLASLANVDTTPKS